jgi:hypothetical protein
LNAKIRTRVLAKNIENKKGKFGESYFFLPEEKVPSMEWTWEEVESPEPEETEWLVDSQSACA